MKKASPIEITGSGLFVYMIFDKLADRYGSPVFTAMYPEQFIESYRSSIINNLEQSAKLQDCEAYQYGTFDAMTGIITPLDRPKFLFRFSDFLKEAIKAHENNPHIEVKVTSKEYSYANPNA